MDHQPQKSVDFLIEKAAQYEHKCIIILKGLNQNTVSQANPLCVCVCVCVCVCCYLYQFIIMF